MEKDRPGSFKFLIAHAEGVDPQHQIFLDEKHVATGETPFATTPIPPPPPPPPPPRPAPILYPHGLGTLTRRGIDVASFGLAKPIAETLARIMGAKSCRCDARAACLDRLCPDVREVGILKWIEMAPKILACVGA